MKLEHIVGLAVRLFSIALAIYALRNGITLVPYFQEQDWQLASYSYLALMACLLLIALYLWFFPLTIAKRLVSFKEPGQADVGSATAEEVEVIGFTILGLYLLFNVLSDLVYWGSIWFISSRNRDIPIELSLDQVSLMVATGVELIFVLFLLLGSKGISRLLRRFRYGEGA